MMRLLFPALLVVLLVFPCEAEEKPAPVSCADTPAYHKLDFWVGTWDVEDSAGAKLGENVIEKILNQCAIVENWKSTQGSEGKSLFYYVPKTQTWKQVGITERATITGGTKEKRLVEELSDGSLRFQGEIWQPKGGTYLDRTTLTPLSDGRVRQVIEYSTDEGANWRVAFSALYIRR